LEHLIALLQTQQEYRSALNYTQQATPTSLTKAPVV